MEKRERSGLHHVPRSPSTDKLYSFETKGVKHNSLGRDLSYYATHPASYWTSSKAFAIWWAEGRRILKEVPAAKKLIGFEKMGFVRRAIPANLDKVSCLLVRVDWTIEDLENEEVNGSWYDLHDADEEDDVS